MIPFSGSSGFDRMTRISGLTKCFVFGKTSRTQTFGKLVFAKYGFA